MQKKRGQGEGTIARRKNGGWCARISAGWTADGKQKRVAFYGKTRQEVVKKMTSALDALNKGTYAPPSKLTVEQWLGTWMHDYKRLTVKAKTYAGYAQTIQQHISPATGKVLLTHLRPDHLQRALNAMAEKELSTSTIHQAYVIVHSALKQALLNGLVTRNAADGVTPPKTRQKEGRAATPEEQAQMCAAFESHRYGLYFLLALYTGLRRGELLALRWADTDFEHRIFRVRQTLDRIQNTETDGPGTKIYIGPPKTDASVRDIPMDGAVVSILKRQKAVQAGLRLKAGGLFEEQGFVFTNDLGKHLEPRYIGRQFQDIMKKLGISGLTIHSLRHTFGTLAMEANVNPRILQDLMGHADISTTARYQHPQYAVKAAAVSQIAEQIESVR